MNFDPIIFEIFTYLDATFICAIMVIWFITLSFFLLNNTELKFNVAFNVDAVHRNIKYHTSFIAN